MLFTYELAAHRVGHAFLPEKMDVGRNESFALVMDFEQGGGSVIWRALREAVQQALIFMQHALVSGVLVTIPSRVYTVKQGTQALDHVHDASDKAVGGVIRLTPEGPHMLWIPALLPHPQCLGVVVHGWLTTEQLLSHSEEPLPLHLTSLSLAPQDPR